VSFRGSFVFEGGTTIMTRKKKASVEAAEDTITCTSTEWFDLARIQDPEERARRIQEIRSRPPPPPPEPMTPHDLTEGLEQALSQISDHDDQLVRLSDRLGDVEEKVFHQNERIENLERGLWQQMEKLIWLQEQVRDGGGGGSQQQYRQQPQDDGFEYMSTGQLDY